MLIGIHPLVLAVAAMAVGLLPETARGAVDYAQDIKPLIRERCTACHGALKQKAGLRLDTVEMMLKGGKSGLAVQRGEAAKSLLITRVATADLTERMPPEHEGEPLSEAQVQQLRDWINAGAPAPAHDEAEADPREHWAFRPRRRPLPPTLRRRDSFRNPIDAFIGKPREELGLTPQPEAPRAVLLRRLCLDLVGLPPTPDEIAAIERDPSPDWYERTVDRLLEDPRYGERWARHWMDVWRYSDWWGLGDQLRNSQKHLWHWRDWIVESSNADLPYDEMIRQMLAADELYPNDPGKLRATGYLARNYFLFNRHQWLEETVEHVSKGFLGLTMNCAKCHDHKYDPITQEDFYRMRAFFEPYHVRLDVLPGQADLAQDGLPRVFDGLLDAPTYRFVRGQENNPDKSSVIAPGVPSLLAFRDLAIQPVVLPEEAWAPERRPWVLAAHQALARSQIEPLETAYQKARMDRDAVQQSDHATNAVAVADAELKVSELALALATAESASVDRRAEAMRASWAHQDLRGGAEDPPIVQAEVDASRAALQAGREVASAKARHGVAVAELQLLRAAVDKKEAGEKELKEAREALDKAAQKLETPFDKDERYAALPGALWTPTRFLDSTKDDPKVEFPPQSTGRRTALAEWITDPRNPLTSRVAVNHLWNRHFGTPLAANVFDLGRKNPPPLHQDLMDWLACELVDSGWSLKHLHRLIVNSATYRLSSSAAGAEADMMAKDPDNLRWWRRTPIRIEAEAVRDSILALAGDLDLTRGGPPVLPVDQDMSKRRSLYFFQSNNDRNLFLTTFDEANVKECYRRDQTIVPQQALALSNSRLVLDAAGPIAARLSHPDKAGAGGVLDDRTFIRRAFPMVLGFAASEADVAASEQALKSWRQLPEAAVAGGVNDTARIHLIWALINHNDFVTLR